MFSNTLKIAIAGIGTVGQGLLDLIKKSKLKHITNAKLEISAIASRRKKKFTGELYKKTKIFDDAEKLLKFGDYDVLVELIGGEDGIAKKIVFDALKKKKNVVTANKALVSKHWDQLKKLSLDNECSIKFEAAVAGGIPIIKVIDDFLVSNKIKRIYGILNGTSNYILSNMLITNKNFDEILFNAQELGYAESDPSFDIDGVDTAHKLSILSSLSFNINSNIEYINVEGIRGINLVDLKYADSLGYKIKLLGITETHKNKIGSFVYPCLVEKKSLISNVDGVYNGIVVESDFCKKSFFQGEGAGSFPTATSVLSDIITILKSGSASFTLKLPKDNTDFAKIEERFGSYYLRFTTLDKPGVVSGISNQFKKCDISMKSMLQKDPLKDDINQATIVVTTHNCKEKNMITALNKIDKLDFILKKTVYLRIESFK